MLELPENRWFERKSGVIRPTDLAVPLVALANSEGGIVVVGLSNGQISPVSDRSDNDLRQTGVDFTTPAVRMHVRELATGKGRTT